MNTNDAEFFKKLRSTFKIEAHEHLRNLSLALMDLEKIPTLEDQKTIVETIHREFHSLKGAARAVSMKEIETICHILETIFSKAKKKTLRFNVEMFDIFNKALDNIEEILSLHEDHVKDISEIMNELKKIECGNFEKKEIMKSNDVHIQADRSINLSTHIKPHKNIEPNHIQEEKENKIKAKEHLKSKEDIKKQNMHKAKITEDSKDEIVRISKAKLDVLLLQGEEMIYAKLSAIQRAKEIKEIKELFDLWRKEKDFHNMEMLENHMDRLLKSAKNEAKMTETMIDTFMENIKGIMLLPFSSIIEMFPKMVRDLSRHVGKEIEFISNGKEIEVDRRILEEMKDPLMHIIRNCIDHGIEEQKERKRLNKPLKGTINLTITQVSSDKVEIKISDDGAGIDIDKVKEKVVKNKLLTREQVDRMNDENAKMLIFKSGLSTSDIITDLSGRGLGLPIVYEKVQKLEGTIAVKSERGKGTVFTIVLPITISTNRGILVKVAKQDFVIPTGKVEKVLRIKKDQLKIVENRATIMLDESIIPVLKLQDLLELKNEKIEQPFRDVISILVVKEMKNKIGLSVDEIIIEQEVLVKRFNKQLKKVRNIAGATILGSGQVVPILDVQDLIKSSLRSGIQSLKIIKDIGNHKNENKSIIVVEDSITSRTLLKNILETQGYSVKTAVDGLQGWKMLKSEKFDLVITDVEMPKMNGFELTAKIREDYENSEIPIILVTSLESREDKERGIDVGASAYIVKSDFQQNNLLEIVKRLI
ncbi:hybrid sensor histidine kinase/response regulator [Crassaminicella profunda]|uniref:hybrid sensor histidine kinase/response regulator n=1 Tax=Crassaminicella profunda TaxID=1286698 RepID=UPI001CA66BE9|nr:response regulator [Crassaminicella profunda]QZY57297.1 response regulator [Crassaminicella profunda]